MNLIHLNVGEIHLNFVSCNYICCCFSFAFVPMINVVAVDSPLVRRSIVYILLYLEMIFVSLWNKTFCLDPEKDIHRPTEFRQ